MNKIVKISSIMLIILALVMNLHSAIFAFYGIKKGSLPNAIWAAALASSSDGSSSSGGTSSGGGSNSGSSDNLPWQQPTKHPVFCNTLYYAGSVSNHGDATVSVTTDSTGKETVSVNFSSSSSTNYTGSIAARWTDEIRCDGPTALVWCTNVSPIEACTGTSN
jgi:hypothetical protein